MSNISVGFANKATLDAIPNKDSAILGQVIVKQSDGSLLWQDQSGSGGGGFTDPMTTRGDVIYKDISNITNRLPIGAVDQVLTSDGTDISWEDATGGFSDPMTTRGDVIIRNSSNVTDRLGVGTTGQYITTDGTDISWGDLTTGDMSTATFYDTTGGQALTTSYATINIDTTETNNDATAFTLATDQVTIGTTGYYSISYNVGSIESGSATRGSTDVKLQLNTGGGMADITSSFVSSYWRTRSGNGNDTSKTINISLTAGDIIQMQAKENVDGSSTVADRSTISFTLLTGARGEKGDTGATGGVDTSGTPVANDFARFTDVDTIEGRSYSETKTDLSLNNVENTALSTWAGTSNIVTVGALNAGSITSGFGQIDNGASDILTTGDIGATGSRVTKGWFTDLEVTNAIVGDITGNSATVATIAGLAPDTATTQATQPSITSIANLTTIGTIETGVWEGTAITDTYISSAVTWNAKQDALTFGIANTNAVDIDSASIASGEYAKFTANGLESKTFAEVKTDLSLNNVENTALTTWAGSANITTLGTIGTGTWEATDVGVAHGGTGKSAWTQYLIPYADTTTSFSQIPIGTDGQVLTSGGAGVAPSFEDAGGGGGSVGGLYGVNAESLSAGKTLTADTDNIYQYLNANGASRVITMDTASASAGDRFVISNTTSYNLTYTLTIVQGANTLEVLYAGATIALIYNGTNWVSYTNGQGSFTGTTTGYNVAVGQLANSRDQGVAIGYSSNGSDDGVAIGRSSVGTGKGVAVGKSALCSTTGVAIGNGAQNNSKQFSVALGYKANVTRTAEIVHNISSDSDDENNTIIVGISGDTADATPLVIFCGGVNLQRLTVRASSVLSFTIQVTARDNVSGDCAVYHFKGGIKRDGSNNTTLLTTTKDVVHEDDASWDCAVTADDTNEALIITVTGDATNAVQWVARLDGVETHF